MSTPFRSTATFAHTSPTSVSTDPTMNKRQKTDETTMMASKSSTTTTSPTTAAKTNPTSILTYEVLGSGVSVQVLSSHTILQLVAVVCDETVVGRNEGVYDHMWIVHDPMEGKSYESGDVECMSDLRASDHRLDSIEGAAHVGHRLILEYDYGTTSTYQLVLKSVEELANGEGDRTKFPRRAPLPGQAKFSPYQPGPGAANLNELYPGLNKFLFVDDDGKLEIYLFQPGKKKVQGFVRKEYDVCHMIHLPEKFASVDDMLAALDQSVKVDVPSMAFEWFGVTVFPRNCASNRLTKYKSASTAGLNITVQRGSDQVDSKAFLQTFPKTAAAAGFNKNGKPSKANERGWISYRNGVLTVCRGNSRTIKSNAPSPGVFDGESKHEPENDGAIVGKVNVEVNSLQELFCAVEALW